MAPKSKAPAAVDRATTPPPTLRRRGVGTVSEAVATAGHSPSLPPGGSAVGDVLPLPSRPRHDDALAVFTGLWAQVMFLQVVKLYVIARKATANQAVAVTWFVLMASACLVAAIVPARGSSTVLLSSVSIIVLWCTGHQSNHVFMECAVCVAVLLTYSSDRKKWQAQASHAVHVFLLALYWVTGIHKLNADWDDSRWSCCSHMLGGILALPPFEPIKDIVPVGLGPYIAAITEIGLPLLLLRGRGVYYRIAAVWGCLFHLPICLMLSPMSVYPFSVLLVPVYVLVIPAEAAWLLGRAKGIFLVPVIAILAQRWTQWMAPDMPEGTEPFEYPPYGCWAVGVVFCVVVYPLLLVAAVFSRAAHEPPSATLRGRFLAFGVFMFGMCPYFGIRNYPALAMFSNLRTEAGRSNHVFIGDDLDFIGWQRDYVTIHETDIRALYLAQVDLAPLYTAETKKTLELIGSERQFWLTPPLEAWPYNYTRTKEWYPYSMPFLEMRRRIAPLYAANATGRVVYSRTVAKAQLRWPAFWQWLGVENLPEDKVVRDRVIYDLSEGGEPEMEEPLPWWLASIARWRTFDVNYSPCRH